MKATIKALSAHVGPSRAFAPASLAKALSLATSSHAPSQLRSSSRSLSTPRSSPLDLSKLSQRANRSLKSHLPRSYSSVSSVADAEALIQTTTLPNGVRIATEGIPGHFSAVGVYVDTGSRYERPWVPGESGISHLIDRMAFKSTSNRSAEDMTTEIGKLGGNVMCSSSRETIMYQSAMFHQDVASVLSILADTIQHPLLLSEELDAQKLAAEYEIGEIWSKPEMILPEVLHTVAYRDNTLGNPLLCPQESLPHINSDTMREFMKMWYTPDRVVVAGAGMHHDQLVELSERYFGAAKARESVVDAPGGSKSSSSSRSSSLSSLFSSNSSGSSSTSSSYGSADFSTTAKQAASHASGQTFTEIASAKARYTGGQLYMPQDDLEFTHVYVGFEGVSVHDDDIYALATLQILLGGGSSFSAGGPGKGMYSRLYNVLNTQHAVDFCSSFLHSYADSALFGIAVSCEPRANSLVGNIIARELEYCTGTGRNGTITRQELSRARNQLKSSLMMALESRLVQVEDLGRQVQMHGKKVTVEEMCEKIDAVDVKTLQRVACRMLMPSSEAAKQKKMNNGLGSGQATVVAQGNLEGLGDLRAMLYRRGLGSEPTA